MTAAIICGDTTLTETELQTRIAATDHGVDVPGRVVAIRRSQQLNALTQALAVRAAGGVPLVGDDRWDATYWKVLRTRVRALAPAPGIAWATFTSGSTGTPRMIVRTDASWSASYPGIERLTGLTAADVVYLPSPLISSVTMFSISHAQALGATILLPRTHAVSGSDLEHATVLHGTPYALRDIVELAERGNAHRIRVALIGGARLDDGLRRRAEAVGIRVVSYYGAAELSFVAADSDGQGLRAFDGVDLHTSGGVLWVRSPYLASGYLGEASGPLRRDPDGFATVGDHVDIDADGRLRLLGRSDGAILTAAATVVPEDVEAALLRIDGIADAVVFAVPHQRTGSLVAAAIEPAPGCRPPSISVLRARTGALLTGSHRPRRWFWTASLPRTAAGKPARQQIRSDAIEGRMARLD